MSLVNQRLFHKDLSSLLYQPEIIFQSNEIINQQFGFCKSHSINSIAWLHLN